MKDVVYRPEADADLDGIWAYTLEQWGLQQALKYDADLTRRIEGLATGATASRRAEEVGPGLRRALVGSHVVFFREDAAAVTVVRVLHQRMDVGRG
ncbi:type II toxin-antitoxin system RelE/ParE family toxin [Roseicyclus mahoneyensis]|uniref:Toxin n=1 Tax=Roseicyclus mahoneyensis TaxID=164332 RepID=A0A316GGK0_9RHOB|nr:type II toxin-antitoxin system RelE/ParE family toxin [Roseicyclus mahoneyensis]PWK60087.1 toxin ParE1/3/4 [Roseicyclus mahoneyensis]